MSTYNWNNIRLIYGASYLLIAINILVAYLILNGTSHFSLSTKKINDKIVRIHAKRGVKLHSKPNSSSNSILNIGNGEQVIILNDTSSLYPGWIKIKYSNTTGWIWRDYVK